MGWYYTQSASWRDIVEELVLKIEYEYGGYRYGIPAHCLRGNTLWTVEGRIHSEHELYDSIDRFIGCYLLQNNKGYGWGYKPMDESMHPCSYTCPVKYLAMAPVVQCQAWRDEVMKRHARMNPAFRIGQKV